MADAVLKAWASCDLTDTVSLRLKCLLHLWQLCNATDALCDFQKFHFERTEHAMSFFYSLERHTADHI
jgi:hypothetical protein